MWSENLLVEDSLVINDFLYFHERGRQHKQGKIFADRCEIYKGYGLFLYQGERLVYQLTNDIQEVTLVEVSKTKYHYCIKGSDWELTTYLVVKERPEQIIEVGQQVLHKGEFATGLVFAYISDPEIFEKFKEELEKEHLWNVIGIKEGVMLTIQQGEKIKWVDVSDVITVEKVKEQGDYYKENIKGVNGL